MDTQLSNTRKSRALAVGTAVMTISQPAVMTPTEDQQFEAYRELGVHVAEGLFSPALLGGNVNPPTIAQWFRCLAASLLEPESTRA